MYEKTVVAQNKSNLFTQWTKCQHYNYYN
jgi:hypothetical protein